MLEPRAKKQDFFKPFKACKGNGHRYQVSSIKYQDKNRNRPFGWVPVGTSSRHVRVGLFRIRNQGARCKAGAGIR